MTIPQEIFSALLWGAVLCVAGASVYLLIVLVRDWRTRNLW
jgi:hypothetical protein